ncbi:MAG: HAMP domain-containing sensor histidine kinase [Dysosmobacter sp.]|nr:HAMP domain-containing sensor histidine kinase [Dysosmobacter sp.]
MLLNTYPVLVSQDLVFHSKVANMQSSVSVIATSLGPLERLTEENVGSAMLTAEEAGLSRILVTDGSGRILYDTRETGSALGQYVFYAEVVQALRGYDSAACRYENGAFRTGGATPVMYRNQIIGAVYAYEYDTEQAELLAGFQRNLLRVSGIVAAIVVGLSAVLSRVLTRQIRELLEAIRSVREGAYSHRAAVEGRDELSQIAQEFNSLTDRLQTTEEARRRFVSDASHELKTPLAAIRLLTDSILQTDDIDPATTREFVADIGQEANRLSRITEDLLQLTRLDGDVLPSAAVVDPLPILEQVLRMMELIAEERGITLTYQAEEGCRILGSMDETRQIIYNLVDNAVKYNRDGGKVEIELKRQGEEVLLTVADEGVGIPEEELAKIFQRFYRVDKARSRAAGGTGLGLSIVRDTLEKRGGSISVANRPGGGAVFTVRWPQAEERGEQA